MLITFKQFGIWSIFLSNLRNLSRINMWKVKQKVCPRYEVDLPVAKVDSLGNLISNQDELKSKLVVGTRTV